MIAVMHVNDCKMPSAFILLIVMILSGCMDELGTKPDESFAKFYNSGLSGMGYDVKQTADGGYVLVGTVVTANRGKEIYLLKTNASGNLQWGPKSFGGTMDDNGYCIQIDNDSGYVIAGSIDTMVNGNITSRIYVVKTNNIGDVIWTKVIGEKRNEQAYFIQLNGNDGYLVAGYTENFESGGKDAYLVSLDLNGNINWARTYGGNWDDIAKCVQVTNTGFILIGSSQFTAQGDANILIVRTNSIGLIEQTTRIGESGHITGEYILALPDAGFIGVGTKSSAGNNSSIYLFKLDNDINNMLWSKDIGGNTGSDAAKTIKLTSDNGIVIAGSHRSSENSSTFYFGKTDIDGNELFSRYYGLSGVNGAENIEQTTDNGFIIIGTCNIEGYSTTTLIKLMPDGEL